jgi:hypothetical protein
MSPPNSRGIIHFKKNSKLKKKLTNKMTIFKKCSKKPRKNNIFILKVVWRFLNLALAVFWHFSVLNLAFSGHWHLATLK